MKESGIQQIAEIAKVIDKSINTLRDLLYNGKYPEETQVFLRELVQRLGKTKEPFQSLFGQMILMAAEDFNPTTPRHLAQDKIRELVVPLLTMSLEPGVSETMREIQIRTAIELLENLPTRRP
ncbi:MAG TPA: hypothetical protein V6D27_01110 [Vampirovibrionales bacterium]